MKRKVIVACVLVLVAAVGVLGWCLIRQQAPNYDDCPPSVMVDGETYFCFSEKAEAAPEKEKIAGQIRTCVDISGMPMENDQSNFPACLDQPYAWVDGELLLYYGGQWNVCPPADSQE